MLHYLLQILIITYQLFGLPCLLGLSWSRVRKKNIKSFSYIYVYGYLVYFVMFFLYSRVPVYGKWSFTRTAKYWFFISIIIGVAAVIYVAKQIGPVIKSNFRFLRNATRNIKLVAAFFALLCACSILFVVPSYEDDTTEVIMTSLATDTMCRKDPYLGTTCVTDDIYYSAMRAPLQILYAIICRYTGMRPVKFVHYVLPFFLLIFFFLVYYRIARQLFYKETEKQCTFLFFVFLLYASAIYSERLGIFGVFQNIWMPKTLLFNCILPFEALLCLGMMNHFMAEKAKMSELPDYIWDFILIILAAQTICYSGLYYALLMLLCGIVVILIRRIYRKCRA